MKGPNKKTELRVALGTEKGAVKPLVASEHVATLVTDDNYSLATELMKDGFCRIVLTDVASGKTIELWAGPIWALAHIEPLHAPRVVS